MRAETSGRSDIKSDTRHDQLAAQGNTTEQIARQLGVSAQTLYNWRKRYTGISVNQAKELKALKDQNDQLKRLVAVKELEILGLREIAAGNF